MQQQTAAAATAAGTPPGERFPKPDPAGAYGEYKIRDAATGDVVRRPTEDWDGAKRRAASDPEWKAWTAGRRADIDDWIAKRRDHTEWICGWYHDFVSPKDGSFLTWTPDEPGPDTPLRSPSDPKVALTPKLHAAWVYNFRIKHIANLEEAARLYRLTGERSYADWVAGQFDFYADNFEKWPAQTRNSQVDKQAPSSRLFWQSLDEAVALTHMIEAARLIWDTAAPERRRGWYDKLFKPQTVMLENGFQFVHNIACWHRSAEAHVALLYDDADLWKTAIDGKFGIRKQLAEGVTSDYLWYEQSLGYNSYVMMALLPLFVFAGLTGRGDSLKHEMEIAENLIISPLALRFPDGSLPTPADSGRGRAVNVGLFGDASRVFPTTVGNYERARTKSWAALVDPAPSGAATSGRDPVLSLAAPVSRSLESSRMAVLVKDGWQVYFHYGQLNASHSQAEALNYEVWNGHTDLSHDPGTTGYGAPLTLEFLRKGLAHNAVLVHGDGQEGWEPGELLSWDADKATVTARQPKYRKDAQATRTLSIDGDRLIDVAKIELTAADAHAAPLGLALQLQGRADLPAGFAPVADLAAFTAGRPAAFKYWEKVSARSAPANQVFLLVHYPDHAFRVTLTADAPVVVYHGSTPDTPPKRRETVYLESAAPARSLTVTTVWEHARP